jgi:HD-like signal output (HDOD) protein
VHERFEPDTRGQHGLQEKALGQLGKLPPFSPVLSKLMASLADEDVSFSEIAGWIEKDTVLAGNMLRLVNSALYGLRGTVNSVRHAVSLLGLSRIRNTAMSISLGSCTSG